MPPATPAQRPPQSGATSLARIIAGSLEGRLATLLMLVSVALILWPLNGLERDYDEGVYWQSLRAMASGRPLFTSVFSSQPPFFLVSLYPFYMLFGQSIAAARFGVAVFAIVGVIAMYWLGRALGGHWVGLVAAALLAFDPAFLHEARTLQAEAPAIALEIVAVALALAASRRAGRLRAWLALASGFALALGALIKLLDVVAIVPMIAYLATPLWVIFSAEGGRLRWPTWAEARPLLRPALAPVGWACAGGALGGALVLAPFLGSFGALWSQVVTFHLTAAQVESANLGANLLTILGGMKVLGVPTLLALGLAIWRRAWRLAPPLLWLLASIVTLARQAPLFSHHIALVIPCMALTVALGLTLPPLPARAALRQAQALGYSAILIACALWGVGFGAYTAGQAAQAPSDATTRLVSAIAAFTTPDQPIVSDDQYALALANRSTPPELVDTSLVRIATKRLTAAQLEAILGRPDTRYVVLATGRLTRVPGFDTWLTANFHQLIDLGGGVAIYERAPSTSPIV